MSARQLAELAVDGLVTAKLVAAKDFEWATEIVAEEITVWVAMGELRLRRDTAALRSAVLDRWMRDLNWIAGSPERAGKQCDACKFHLPLVGALGEDWGVCTNASSPFDRRAMFGRDGCDHCEAR